MKKNPTAFNTHKSLSLQVNCDFLDSPKCSISKRNYLTTSIGEVNMRHSLPHQASLHLSDGDPRPRSRFTPDKTPAFGFFSVNNFSLALRGTSQTGGIFLGNGISQTGDAICQRQKSHRSLAPSIYPPYGFAAQTPHNIRCHTHPCPSLLGTTRHSV